MIRHHLDWNWSFRRNFSLYEVNFLSRIIDYWNRESSRFIHLIIINCMSCSRWEQIKRFLKIFSLIIDEKVDNRDFDWWKKLNSLITFFRNAFKKSWTSDSHVSIDEHLVGFRGRSAHAMQLACKAAEVSFKLYNIYQNNYLFDFLFTSKIWSQNIEKQAQNADNLLRLSRLASWWLSNSWVFLIVNENWSCISW